MPAAFPHLKKYLLFTALLFCFYNSKAQTKYDAICFTIDSFANVGLPKSALKKVETLDSLARKKNNAAQQIRASIYRMTFQSYVDENGLEAIITRLRQDIDHAKYPVKPVLQSLLAQTYWNYYIRNSYQFSQRTALLKPDSDFTKWDLRTLLNETNRLYDLSLSNTKREQATPVGVLDGVLEGDITTRYLRPTLYDLLIQRAFDFFLSSVSSLPQPRLPFSVDSPAFFSDNHTFAAIAVKTSDTASLEYKGMIYLQQATRFHLKHGDSEALADLDLQRLKFVHDRSKAYYRDSLYFDALDKVAKAFSSTSVSADALLLEGSYYQAIDSLVKAHYLLQKAKDAWPRSLGGKNASLLLGKIDEKTLQLKVESEYVPNKPILALLTYKNLAAARVAVYRLTAKQHDDYLPLERMDDAADFLKELNPVQRKNLRWDTVQDYKSHTLEFKLDSLDSGSYMVMVNSAAPSDSAGVLIADFNVSNLAVARRTSGGGIELLVTDRTTGKPVKGAKVVIRNPGDPSGTLGSAPATGKTDENGLFNLGMNDENFTLNVMAEDDTLRGREESFRRYDGDYEYGGEQAVLFTDRQIYRPGQTIYFKGLELLVYQGGQKIVTGQEVRLGLSDANGRQLSEQTFKSNEFGTFSGSFVIPQSVLAGNASIHVDYPYNIGGSVGFRIEEYKRPGFHVAFLPFRESHKLNDSVTIAGNATAFSGYGLSNARVAIHIIRSRNYPYRYYGAAARWNRRYNDNTKDEILTDTIKTDNQGRFKLKFKAIPGRYLKGESPVYNYNIMADVTDEAGETHPGLTNVLIGNNDINLDWMMPDRLFAKDTLRRLVSVLNLNDQRITAKINIDVYALKSPGELFKNRTWELPEQYGESREDFKQDFPGYPYKNEDSPASWPVAKQVITLAFDADTAKAALADLSALSTQPSGIYRVTIRVRSAIGDTLSQTNYVHLINGKPAVLMQNWLLPEKVTINKGDSASFFIGINRKINVLEEFYNGTELRYKKWLSIDTGVRRIKIAIADTIKYPIVQFVMVYQNRAYSSYNKIQFYQPEKKIGLKFITFRNKLQPGEKEEWKLQLTGPGDKKADAEMLAGMYDASLDDIFAPDNWFGKVNFRPWGGPGVEAWDSGYFVRSIDGFAAWRVWHNYLLERRDYERLNLLGYDYYGGYNYSYHKYLEGAAERKDALEPVAVIGQGGRRITGTVLAKDDGLPIPGASVKIKGTNTRLQTDVNGKFTITVPGGGVLVFEYIGYEKLEVSKFPKSSLNVRLNSSSKALGEVVVTSAMGIKTQGRARDGASQYNKDLSSADVSSVSLVDNKQLTEGQAAGVQVAGDGTGNTIPFGKPIIPRTNFNETAFFYPQLRTDEKGQVLIDFTIPEALTRWKFRGLAHTRDMDIGYTEAEILTQKQLSIISNTPRFLREGDTIIISATLANLTAGSLKGKIQLQLFNAVSMKPVDLFVDKADALQDFSVEPNTNKAVSFKLAVPLGLDALDYRLTADAGDFSDGEENTLPVLPNRMLVIESMPMMVRCGQTKTFTFNKLVNQHSATLKSKTLTLEYTNHPAWYAVQALPYIMEYAYECSEQVFSRFFANSLATDIINKNPAIKKVFDQWRNASNGQLVSNLEKNQELKATLLEETPWLRSAWNEDQQKRMVAVLFDLNSMREELKEALDKLQRRQMPDGGFPWYGGESVDRYMTQHILEGMGELVHLHITGDNEYQLQQMAYRTIGYVDGQLVQDEGLREKDKNNVPIYSDLEIHAWFARSYFPTYPMNTAVKTLLDRYLIWAQTNWVYRNVYEQGMIALTMQRYGKSNITAQIEKSLLETAQASDELGMYWAKNLLGYYWYEAPVETQSLLIELFTEAGDNTKAVDEMKIWLLRNKQTNSWETTKATSAACYALLMKGSDLLADTGTTAITLGGKPLAQLKPDVKADAGTGYLKTSWQEEQVKPELGKVELKNTSKTISWGALHWQYFENLDKITSANTNIRLRRKYFIQKQTDAGAVLTEVDATHQPKVGDLLKVVVYLDADRDFEYVQLKDMRPAGTEPVDALSEYKYQDALWYYQVTKDVATNFFISYLPKGSFVFEYRLRVAQPGNFSTGISSIQCMYAPEFNAHSEGSRMAVRP